VPENTASCVAILETTQVRCFHDRPRCEAYVASRPREMLLSACVVWD
jgi:hypothetical protein